MKIVREAKKLSEKRKWTVMQICNHLLHEKATKVTLKIILNVG